MSTSYDLSFKVLMLGESSVGKTSLMRRIDNRPFTESFITTIGVDFQSATLTLEGKRVKLQIWDTAGQERFRSITNAYYRGSQIIILVYDITDEESFQKISQWVQDIESKSERDHLPTVSVLIGNKIDFSTRDRVVTFEQGRKLAEECGMLFYETSAKDLTLGTNIMTILTEVAIELMHMRKKSDGLASNQSQLHRPRVDINASNTVESKCCA